MSSLGKDGDGLDDLMELETGFYDEGYRTGLEDGTQAGVIEGKLFGIEKGFEKALEMGKLRGRAMVWKARLSEASESTNAAQSSHERNDMAQVAATLPHFPDEGRLRKQVESLLKLVHAEDLDGTNSDTSVAAFDDLMIKARNKAKVISNITGEALNVATDGTNAEIEDARGLSARH